VDVVDSVAALSPARLAELLSSASVR
jgi:hypothetical protein